MFFLPKKLTVYTALLLLFIFSPGSDLDAASWTIRGTVISSETGEPLPVVSVMIKGRTGGTVTDMSGRFRLRVYGDNLVLRFRRSGMNPLSLAVTPDMRFITVRMTPAKK